MHACIPLANSPAPQRLADSNTPQRPGMNYSRQTDRTDLRRRRGTRQNRIFTPSVAMYEHTEQATIQ
jgi:hypothetical protein